MNTFLRISCSEKNWKSWTRQSRNKVHNLFRCNLSHSDPMLRTNRTRPDVCSKSDNWIILFVATPPTYVTPQHEPALSHSISPEANCIFTPRLSTIYTDVYQQQKNKISPFCFGGLNCSPYSIQYPHIYTRKYID